jgi:hypothetical protein
LEENRELRTSVVEFVKLFHNQNGTIPSVTNIIEEVKEVRNRTRLYDLFPGGVPEIATAAGLPPPEERMHAVTKALEAKKETRIGNAAEGSTLTVQLTVEQSRRLYGICQLEGGLDPAAVIDMLLDLDTELRRKHQLSLSKAKTVSDFLAAAVARGWKPDWVVEYVTRLYNSRIMNLDETYLNNLMALVQGIDLRYWGSIETFINYATKHSVRIGYYRAYCEGTISLEQLLQAEGLQ